MRSDEQIAAEFGVPVEKVRRLDLDERGRANLVRVELSGKDQRRDMPIGTPIATIRDADGKLFTKSVHGSPTPEDPQWQGSFLARLTSRDASTLHRNVVDPRPHAGAHVGKRVRIRCPHCGALVAELHEFENDAALFHRIQAPDWWGVVRIEAGKIGAGCRDCIGPGEMEVETGKVAQAWRESESTGRPVTVKTGRRPGATR